MIIGHKNIIESLENNIRDNNILHAYIFSGIDGIGKKKVAFDFAKKIMCKNEKDKIMFDNMNHPDFKYICEDEKNSIKIEQIREMVSDISIKPVQSEYKVYIVDNADKITIQAQNALLKTLEEPSTFCVIILITSKYYELIDTIRSRATKVDFQSLSNNEIKEYMNNNQIQIDIDENKLMYLIDGSIKNIYSIVENKQVIILLNEYIHKFNINIVELNKLSNILVENKSNIDDILEYFIKLLNYEIINNVSNIEIINKYSNNIKVIEQTKKYINGNINFDICIDYLIMHIWEE